MTRTSAGYYHPGRSARVVMGRCETVCAAPGRLARAWRLLRKLETGRLHRGSVPRSGSYRLFRPAQDLVRTAATISGSGT